MKIQNFVFNMFGVNTYVVWNERTLDAAIIDPGMISRKDIERIDSFITKNALVVTHLINTHLHIDHAFGNGAVIEKYGVGVEACRLDEFLGNNIGTQARMFGLDHLCENVMIKHELNDSDCVMIGDEALTVLHVPGHSPGSIALYSATNQFVIVGDVLFESSIGRTDLPGGNYAQLIDSITSKLLVLPDSTIVYPGHGEVTTIGAEKRYNPYI